VQGTETKNKEELNTKNRVAQEKRSGQEETVRDYYKLTAEC